MLWLSSRKNGDDYIGFYDLDKKKCVAKVGGVPLYSHGFKLSEDYVIFFWKEFIYLISIDSQELTFKYETEHLKIKTLIQYIAVAD